MRKAPKTSPPPLTPKTTDRVTRTLEYRVITPLFGGGVETQTADPITVVRAQSVIGQLRFWWRACRAPGFPTPKAMYDQECEIWGSTSTPSQVVVDVRVIRPGDERAPFEVVANRNNKATIRALEDVAPSYAAFPLQPAQGTLRLGMNLKKVRVGVVFGMTLSYPAQLAVDVDAALWAWETLGGLGARTRRGFGSIRRVKVDGVEVTPLKTVDELRQHIVTSLALHVSEAKHKTLCPHLPHKTDPKLGHFRLRPGQGVMDCWRAAIRLYRDFRQQRTPAEPGTNHPGRSYWPEPDVVRRKTNQCSDRHRPMKPELDYMPRSLFGLPIILHFKDYGDPGDATVQGVNGEDRMASRMIIKVIELATGSAAVAFALKGPRLPVDEQGRETHVQLKTQRGSFKVEATTDKTFPALGTRRDPLEMADKTTYILDQTLNAFLKKFDSR